MAAIPKPVATARQPLPMPARDAAILRRYIHFTYLEYCHALVALYGPGTSQLIMLEDAVSYWDDRIGSRKGSVLARAEHLLKAAGVPSRGLPTARRSTKPDRAA